YRRSTTAADLRVDAGTVSGRLGPKVVSGAQSGVGFHPWIQPVSATSSASRCDGVIHPRGCRGRSLSSWATVSSCPSVKAERSVPLGKYWRRSPLVFSLVPRCHGLLGSQKYTWIPVSTVNRACCDIS